jgi:hypothetical protein
MCYGAKLISSLSVLRCVPLFKRFLLTSDVQNWVDRIANQCFLDPLHSVTASLLLFIRFPRHSISMPVSGCLFLGAWPPRARPYPYDPMPRRAPPCRGATRRRSLALVGLTCGAGQSRTPVRRSPSSHRASVPALLSWRLRNPPLVNPVATSTALGSPRRAGWLASVVRAAEQ